MILVRSICVILLMLGAQSSAAERDWSALAVEDLEAAYTAALQDHPGSADERNPDFLAIAEKARVAAMTKARQARNQVQYRQALRTFFGAFEDYHFMVSFPDDEEVPAQQWAGIVTVLDGDRMTVVAAHPSQTDLVGRHILSCDGQNPASLYELRVKPYLARPAIEATVRANASRVFLWRTGQFESRLNLCQFAGPKGTEERQLQWDFNPDDYAQMQRRALRGKRPKPGVREFQPGRWWITASNFNPADAAEQAEIEMMLEDLGKHAADIRTAEAIVVDIRGNGGGSSSYGDQIVDAVWGEAYRRSRQQESPTYVEWRISPGNLAHMDTLAKLVVERNFPEDVVNMFLDVRKGMIVAAEEGELMYRQAEEPEDPADEHTGVVENPVAGQIYFLTNINCGSACLDFADVMRSLENVTQVGQPTTADTQYMEVRWQESPTNLSGFVIPVKVYRDRIRAPKQFYAPSITYDGFDWSTAAVERWIKDLIDDQLRD